MKSSLNRALGLLDGSKTVGEIARLSFCSPNNLSTQLLTQHRAGLLHIAAWKPTGGRVARCYALGPGVDAPKPAAMSGTQRWRKFLECMSAYDRDIYVERLRTNRRKVKSDPLVRAFFGR